MADSARIIIVEDDVRLARSLRRLLVDDGFDVALAFNGADLARLLERGDVDLVLLDLNLGAEDGLDIARNLGGTCDPGVIIITGRGQPSDCVTGLALGADDYLAKPFEYDELRARIGAVLRRCKRGQGGLLTLALGPYRLNTAERRLSREGGPPLVEFTGRESALLARLMIHPGDSIHRADLSRNDSWVPEDRAPDVHVSHIRRKLHDAGVRDLCIEPVRGVGYRLTLLRPGDPPPDGCSLR